MEGSDERPFTGTYLDAKSVKLGSVNGRSPERSRCSTHHGVTSLEDSSFRQIFFLLPVIEIN